MILMIALGAIVIAGAVYAYKHYATPAQVTVVKAEVAKVEAVVATDVDAVKAVVKAEETKL